MAGYEKGKAEGRQLQGKGVILQGEAERLQDRFGAHAAEIFGSGKSLVWILMPLTIKDVVWLLWRHPKCNEDWDLAEQTGRDSMQKSNEIDHVWS